MLILLLLFAGNCGDSLKCRIFSNSYSNSVFVYPLLTNICLNLLHIRHELAILCFNTDIEKSYFLDDVKGKVIKCYDKGKVMK